MPFKPSLWASLIPTGLGEVKPHHFLSMARVAWQNRDNLPYAWRILNEGVCDGCALGTTGLKDWTIEGTHLCMVRLELLRLNTQPALDPELLADVSKLAGKSSAELRALGRLPCPMIRRHGEPGFRRLSWDAAIDLMVDRLRATDPRRAAIYLTSRGIPNETYYAAQKAFRFYGSPHIDNSARLCHAASTVAMKASLGHGASTCSYVDWLGADLIVFGSNVPNNQPVTTKYLYQAKQNGCEVAVVNPYREPGLERYWVPSVAESAIFGTKFTDHFFAVDTGGDLAFLNGVLKALLALPGGIDREFVERATVGFDGLATHLEAADWPALERDSGSNRAAMEKMAQLLVDKPNAIFVWSMGLTQHAHGVDTVRALCNLGLARGLVGREFRGLMPIRGHSGVQGGAEMGAVPVPDGPQLDHYSEVWGFEVPRDPGLATLGQLGAAERGELDLFWIVGGNFLETLPEPARVAEALRRPKMRIHQDIVLTTALLVKPSETVLILPTTTRYEMPGGCTETTTERRIVFSPEIVGPRIGEARPEWQVLCEVMARVKPEQADLIRFTGIAEIRAEIARAAPLYRGIESLEKQGDQVQWGGRLLYADERFATADGKAHFAPLTPPQAGGDGSCFRLSTRRGKQFNSIVQAEVDPLTGSARDDVLISAQDAESLDLVDGEKIRVSSPTGEMIGRARLAPIKEGNVEAHWPEANVLLPLDRFDRSSGEPDYNALVSVSKLDRP